MELFSTIAWRIPLALLLGTALGAGFGFIQQLAWRRHEKLEQAGSLKTPWSVMPGSMRRIGLLIVALVLVQALCPLLFADGAQWWVSTGVCVGYAAILAARLRRV